MKVYFGGGLLTDDFKDSWCGDILLFSSAWNLEMPALCSAWMVVLMAQMHHTHFLPLNDTIASWVSS